MPLRCRPRPDRRHDEGLRGGLAPSGTRAATRRSRPRTPLPARKAQTDFVGIAIHCAAGGGICATANAPTRGRTRCRTRPAATRGFKALFGAKYVNPAIAGGSACVNDTLTGRPIVDPFDQCGFPGFDGMYAKNTLGYVAQMQEARRPGDVRLHLRRARLPRRRRQHPRRVRAGRGRLRPAAEGLRHGVRPVLRPPEERRDHEGQHALRRHRRGGRPLRRHRARQPVVRRRHRRVHLRQRPRHRGERRPQAARRHLQREPRHVRDDELQRPQRPGAERLRQRQPRPRLGHRAEPREGDVGHVGDESALGREREACSWRWPIRSRRSCCTWSRPTRRGRRRSRRSRRATTSSTRLAGTPTTVHEQRPLELRVPPEPAPPPNQTFAWNHGGVQPEIRIDVDRLGRPGNREEEADRRRLDRSHGHPPDDARAARPEGRLRLGRPGRDRDSSRATRTPKALQAHDKTVEDLGAM